MISYRIQLLVIALATSLIGAVHADVRLPKIFSDHMVLQRDKQVQVWGWAAPGEDVRVLFGDQACHRAIGKKRIVRLKEQ